MIVTPAGALSPGSRDGVLVDLPETAAGWNPLTDLQGPPIGFTARQALGPDQLEQATVVAGGTVVVGFAGIQVVLLAAAAFAVSASRQRRELAILSAAGATGRQLRRIVLANGLFLGAVAGLLGVGLGWVTFLAGQGWLERLVDHPLVGSTPSWQLAGVALLVVAAGGIAALGPARSAARRPVRAGLAAREVGGLRTSRRLMFAGLALAGLGILVVVWGARPQTGSALAAAARGCLILLGVVACAPAGVGAVGAMANRATLAVRLALRHGDRHRLRTGAAVAAVCAAMAGTVGLTLFYSADTSTGAATARTAPLGQVSLAAEGASSLDTGDIEAVGRHLPVREVVPIRTVSAQSALAVGAILDQTAVLVPQRVAVGGPEVIQAVTGRPATSTHEAALASGEAVVFYRELDHAGQVRLVPEHEDAIELPAVLAPASAYYSDRSVLPGVLISEQTATALDLEIHPGGVIFDTVRAPSPTELAAAQDVVLAAQAREGAANPRQLAVGAEPRQQRDSSPFLYVLAAVSALVTLIASAAAVGLGTAEMRDDLSTLAAVGAAPRLRRWIAGHQAGLIVGLGTLLGLAGGTAPAVGLISLRSDLAWQVPWLALGLALVAAPVLAVLGSVLLTRSDPVLIRRLR